MMDELLKGLAHKISRDVGGEPAEFENVLRNVGLGELLELGHEIRKRYEIMLDLKPPQHSLSIKDYDRAFDHVRAAVAGAEKGREGK